MLSTGMLSIVKILDPTCRGLKIRICTEKLKSAPGASIRKQFAIALELFNEKSLSDIGYLSGSVNSYRHIMFTPARDFLLETPVRIIIPNPNVSSHSL
jgi:hypothetical protein